MVHLNKSYDKYCHLRCPHCQCGIDVEWTTEYGDPLPGDHSGRCPECGKEIEFNVEVTTTYTAKTMETITDYASKTLKDSLGT